MIEFGIKDVVDIVLVAMMLYYVYRLMKESRSLNVFIGIIVFVIVWLFVSQVLEMRLLGSIMDKLVSVGVIGLIVLSRKRYASSSIRSVRTAASRLSPGSSHRAEERRILRPTRRQ